MEELERRKIHLELKMFTFRNFEKPSACKNPEQIRFYVSALAMKIEALEKQFNYAPDWAYRLLAQYNDLQNRQVLVEFRNSYR